MGRTHSSSPRVSERSKPPIGDRARRYLVGRPCRPEWVSARLSPADRRRSGRRLQPQHPADGRGRATHEQPQVGRCTGQCAAFRAGDRPASGLCRKRFADRDGRQNHAHGASRQAIRGEARARPRRHRCRSRTVGAVESPRCPHLWRTHDRAARASYPELSGRLRRRRSTSWRRRPRSPG